MNERMTRTAKKSVSRNGGRMRRYRQSACRMLAEDALG